MHVHLDPLGGIAGDMFVAAMLDAFPATEAVLAGQLAAFAQELGFEARRLDHHDGVLAGARWLVKLFDAQGHAHDHDHGGHHAHGHHKGHGHRHWADIQAMLRDSSLAPAVQERAIAMFALLAEAEASVHRVPVDEVAFHEVGAVDSIADLVGAAILIEAVGAASWSVGPVPLGGGRVRTAHGWLPVPAPATALLLEGFACIDDGIGGERVTPTGAAILRHLCPPSTPIRSQGVLRAGGHGFGTRRLQGTSNCLRLLSFEMDEKGSDEAVAVIGFEVDDQPAEDLAIGLERLRALPSVLDVLQAPVMGKKGRLATHVQVLATVAGREEAIRACFLETTTIGLRHQVVARRVLAREAGRVDQLRVKRVTRPDGAVTVKAEADDLAVGDRLARARLRRRAGEDPAT